MLHPTTNFGTVYRKLLADLLNKDHALLEFNERTKVNVATLPGAQSFQLDLSNNNLPTCGLRKTHPRTAAAEIAWFLRGSKDSKWLDEREVRIWNDFADKDGTVANAYGYRWRSHFGRDQVGKAVETLQRNPSDRQCYVSAWDPARDGLGGKAKNVPCPVGFSLHVIANRLHLTATMRSSDVFVGLPYDVMGFAMLMGVLAEWISPRLELGTLTFVLNHAHMYDCHFDMARECLRAGRTVCPEIPILRIGQDRPDWDFFIQSYAQSCLRKAWPEFNPRPKLVL